MQIREQVDVGMDNIKLTYEGDGVYSIMDHNESEIYLTREEIYDIYQRVCNHGG